MNLIEKLKEIYDMLCCKAEDEEDECFASTYRANVDGFKLALDIVKQHSDWVSADERLPEDELEVIAVLELTGFYMLAFIKNGIWYNADDGEKIARHKDRQAVTYWMPTPQPPSEVQDD